MSARLKAIVVVATLSVATLGGCSIGKDTGRNTLGGAAIGSAAGATYGLLNGGLLSNALGGAAAGAAGGFVYDQVKKH